MAAEYVAKEGNERIILCERGIKTFETLDPLHARPRVGGGAEDARPICR